jgi:histidine triad (HIT) family protein
MTDCIFCKIIARQAPGEILYQDEQVTALRDIHPAAPVHILVVPNQHIESTNDLTLADEQLMGHLVTVACRLAHEENVADSGYRLIVNNGPNAGQEIFHVHLHVLAGKRLGRLG